MWKPVRNLYRKHFGTWEFEDPRPTAEAAPYTFYLPSENEVLALRQGDLVKVLIRSIPASAEWSAERMWCTIDRIDEDEIHASLDNEPYDIPQLHYGSKLKFFRDYVLDIIWADDRVEMPPAAPRRRDYWDRCLVDACIVYDGVKVHYLYREAPDMGEPDDEYLDSGWRIRADWRKTSDEELENRKVEYVALGAVLNDDDSWLHLIDEPVGSAFIRDWETGEFVPCADECE